MSRVRRFLTPAVVVAALAPAGIACSSATDPTASKALSAREAQVLASALFEQIFGALGTPTGGSATVGSARNSASSDRLVFSRVSAAGARAVYGAAPTGSSFSAPCQLGGNVSGSFTKSDNLDANGTGSFTVSSTYTPNGCVVSTGSRNVTVNGAPSLTMRVNVPLVRYEQAGDATIQMGGGFAYEGGTCQLAYAVSFSASGHGRISGSVCGQDVSQSI